MKNFLFLLATVFASTTYSQTNPVTVTLNHSYITDDAIVHSGTPSTNYASFHELSIMAWTVSGNFITLRSYIRFDLQSLPANAIVTNATLKLKNPPTGNNGGNHASPNDLFVRRVTSSWSESTINWNNKPAASALDEVLVPSSTNSSQNYNINVTNLVQYQLSNPAQNFGFLLRLQAEFTYRAVILSSSNAADPNLRPELEITYYIPCPNLQANFNATNNGQSVAFSNQSIGNGPLSFLWNFGDGDTSTNANPTHFYAQPGNYQVCLQVSDTCGTKSYCDSITISCTGNAGYTSQPYGIRGVSFTNTSTGQGQLSYLWLFGDGNTSTAQNPTHYYAQEGVYQVCLSITDTCGTATYCDTVAIACQNLTASFSYQQVLNSVSFVNLSTGTSGFNSLWTFGDGSFSFLTNPVYTYATPGNYNVCLQITDSCGQRTYCEPITYCPLPTSLFTANPLQGNTVQFVPAHNGANYTWSFGDGNFSSNSSPIYTYLLPGTYQVCLFVQDSCGDADTCMFVGVNNIGLDEWNHKKFSVFPNPARHVVHVQHMGMKMLELFNTDGRQVMRQSIIRDEKEAHMDVSKLPSGIYFLKIHHHEGSDVVKIVVQ